MKRLGWGVLALMGAACASAQKPDVSVFADIRPTLKLDRDARPAIRWMDPEGRVSVVGLRFFLENGSRIKISQRFQNVPGDPESLDEAWINLNREWQVGKQYLPFGRRFLIRETVPAVLFTTRLALDSAPAEVALFDGGEGRPRGVSFRIGRDQLGFSAAAGDHIAVQGASLSPFRDPGEAPGKGRGWKSAYCLDASVWIGPVKLEGEALGLRNGNTPLDRDLNLSDLRASWRPSKGSLGFEAAWSRSWTDSEDVLRLGLSAPLSEKASLRPQIRMDKKGLREASVCCWIRL